MRIIKILPYLIVVGFLVLPLFAGAQMARGERSPEDIAAFVDEVANWLYVVGFAIVLIVVVIGGIQYMTAGGNDEQVQKAKKTIITGLVGAAIILLAGVIVDTVVGFIEDKV